MNFFICGDIMPGGVLPYQNTYIQSDLLNYMHGFDLRIGTLECAIGSCMAPDETKMHGSMNIVYARNEDFHRVKEMRFDIVSLANNHVFDLGEEGLRNTIRLLEENEIKFCGAGMDLSQASQPAVVEVEGVKVAFIAACMFGNKYLGHIELAGKSKSGVNPLEIDRICSDIKLAKEKYDYVFVLPHWGREHMLYPMNECVRMAKEMIECGADGIFGSHSHVPQPLIKYKGKPIVFGMGNFLFPDFYMFPPRPIWYPDKEYDFTKIQRRKGYPDEIQVPSKATWGRLERVGGMVSVVVSKNKLLTKMKFVQMSNKNILSINTRHKSLSIRLYLYGLFIKYPLLKWLYVQSIKIRDGNYEEY